MTAHSLDTEKALVTGATFRYRSRHRLEARPRRRGRDRPRSRRSARWRGGRRDSLRGGKARFIGADLENVAEYVNLPGRRAQWTS